MTKLKDLMFEYVLDEKEEDNRLNKWFDKSLNYEKEISKIKDGHYEPDSEAWDSFIFDLFNNWDEGGYDFWVACNLEKRANYVVPMDLISDIKSCFKWFKDEYDVILNITTMDDRILWNTLAYWYIHVNSEDDGTKELFYIALELRVNWYIQENSEEKRRTKESFSKYCIEVIDGIREITYSIKEKKII